MTPNMTPEKPSDEEIQARLKAFADANTVTMAEAAEGMRRLTEMFASVSGCRHGGPGRLLSITTRQRT